MVDEVPGLMLDVAALKVKVESDLHIHAPRAIADLAQAHGLTAYDAAYLELARRSRRPLATLDKALREAARAARVDLLLS